ncbi:TonB-dependent siderophore receptor [Horticoccus sp. 23ND18S-11]|uniref:TonB-dependent siderophore receptor n=1 Tax=Horticoccus sp. 23ND18S-11 TaxID=3391832 RepID=UPI0039C94A50
MPYFSVPGSETACPRHALTVRRVASLLLIVPAIAFAQVVTPTPTTTTAGRETSPVELSPFEVRADSDVGYQAGNTTSGSRLNSRLKDTPASVSPFTPEFLSDIAATNLQEMLGYATNVEGEFEDSTNGFNNPPGRDSTGNDFRFRVRGVTGSSSVNYVQSAVPVDLYNVERAELASGPNSILFGLGAPGGTVALGSKRAQLNRTRTTLKAMGGSWNYQRFEFDHNHVLLPKRLAVRLLALYQDAEGWRQWTVNDQKRIGGAVTYQPFAKTIVRASYNDGTAVNSVSVPWNATDSVTSWLAANRPLTEGPAVAGLLTGFGTTNRFTFFGQDNKVYNMRNEFFSARAPSTTLVSPALMGYAFNVTGPGGLRRQNFHDASFEIQQRLTKTLVLEAGYFVNKNRILTNGNANPNVFLTGDPNITIPETTGALVANPRARQLYLEDQWTRDPFRDQNELARLSAAWDVNLGRWFGRHRIAGLVEKSEQNRLRRWMNEIVVDANNVAVANVATPEAAGNALFRRQYLTEGDFRTYYAGNPTNPTPTFTFNNVPVHSTYVTRQKSNTHTLQDDRAVMFAAQSFFWKEKIVTTLGYRIDEITFESANQGRVTDRNDPRYTSGKVVLNEWDFDGTKEVNTFKPTTFSTGAVVHVLPRVSAFYNYSRNNGTPKLDRTVLPTGKTPPPTEGMGHDYGVMIDLLGDDRFFFRFARYLTLQTKDAAIIPDGLSVATTSSLGGTNIVNIYNGLLAAGRLTPAQYDDQVVFFNAGIIDARTVGWESELVANPTKNLTLRLGVSYSKRQRENFFNEVYTYFNAHIPEWRRLAGTDAALNALIDRELATAYESLEDMATLQNNPFGSRPYKANITGRYKFNEGKLRGLFVGGAARYQSKALTKYSSLDGRPLWGTPTLFADWFVGHRFKVPQLNLPLSLQLNVRNAFNSYLAGVGRRNAAENGLLRVYLNEPRSYRLTATVDF